MRILSVEGFTAIAEGRGGVSRIDLALIGEAQVGAFVLVHVNTAVRFLDEEEARQIDDATEAVRLAERGEDFSHLLADLIDREPVLPAHLLARLDEEETHDRATQPLRLDG